MNGKRLGLGIVGSALLAGAAVYYLQVYAFYDELAAPDIRLTAASGATRALPVEDFRGIDGSSSPIRYRACFRLAGPLPADTVPYHAPAPLVAPGWFSCFDAQAIAAALASGRAAAVLGEAGRHPGVDRVIAVFDDGRAYAWQQMTFSAKE